MKRMIKISILACLLTCGCEQSETEQEIWQGVYFDHGSQSYVHDPEYNFSLVFENGSIAKVVQPSIDPGYTVESIEIISDTEMDISWKLPEDRLVRTDYSYDDEGNLRIDLFVYTIVAVPFPSNLVEGVFVKVSSTEN